MLLVCMSRSRHTWESCTVSEQDLLGLAQAYALRPKPSVHNDIWLQSASDLKLEQNMFLWFDHLSFISMKYGLILTFDLALMSVQPGLIPYLSNGADVKRYIDGTCTVEVCIG